MRTFYVLGCICLMSSIACRSQDAAFMDSLLLGFEQAPTDSLKYGYADELFWQHIYANVDTALLYVQEALAIADRLESPGKKAQSLNNYAIYCRISGQYRRGDSSIQEAIRLQEQMEDTAGMARSYGNLSNIYNQQGAYERSVEADLAAMKYYEAAGEIGGVGRCLNNLGNTHYAMHQYEESLTYYHRALDISRSQQDTISLAINLGNIGKVEKNLGNLEEALEAYQEVSTIFLRMGYKRDYAFAVQNMGLLFREKKEWQQAESYLMQALEIIQEANNPASLAGSYDNLAKTAILQKQYNKGLSYAMKAEKIASSIGARPILRRIYESIYTSYAGLGAYTEAYQFQERYIKLNDSLVNERNTESIQELEAKFESEKREKEILVLNHEKEMQAQTIEVQQAGINLRNSVIFGVLLALGLAITAVVSYRRKQLLTQREKDLEHQKVLKLQSQQKLMRLNAMIQGEEGERRRIAKDLHDSVGSMLAAIKLQVGQFSEKALGPEKKEKAYSMVNNTYEEVRRIAHNMMPKTLINQGLIPAIHQLGEDLIKSNDIDLHVEVLSDLPPLSEHRELMLYRVIQEVFTNIVKHAHATEVWIQLSYFEGEWVVAMEDNGVGFDTSKAGDGIGMKNIESRISFLEAEWELSSQPGNGTVVSLHVPVQEKQTLELTHDSHRVS